MVGKAVVDQPNRRMLGHQLPRKITFKKAVGMTTVADGHGSRIVVFRDADVTGTGFDHEFVNLLENVRVQVDKNSFDQDEGARGRGSELQNRGMMDFDESVALKFGGSFEVDLNSGELCLWEQLLQCDQIESPVRTKFEDTAYATGSRKNSGEKSNV